MLYDNGEKYHPVGTVQRIPFTVAHQKFHSDNLIPFLSDGTDIPSDPLYIDAYKNAFEILKGIFQGPTGYANFIKQKNASKFHDFLGKLYDDLIVTKGQNYSEYVEQASIAIYDLVLGQERVVLSNIKENLTDFKNNNKLSASNKVYLDQILDLISSENHKAIALLYTLIGKVLEGSLSQARKSLGGYFAEKIIDVLLEKQGFDVVAQDGSTTATNTDFVVKKDDHVHCIAVQLSTNDRMRLSTDEYRADSTNYLISFNGCTVSKKGKTDISSQRMSTWVKESLENNKVVPFYVGRDIFIEEIRKQFSNSYLDSMKKLSTEDIDLSASIESIVQLSNEIIEQNFQDSNEKLKELKTLMHLALWGEKYTMSFEEFIANLTES